MIGAVRAATPVVNVWQRTALTWAAMLGLAPSRQWPWRCSWQGARPGSSAGPSSRWLTQARTLGEGDFSVRTRPASCPEIDQTGEALNVTAEPAGPARRAGADLLGQRLPPAAYTADRAAPRTRDRAGRDGRGAARQQPWTPSLSADELERTIEELLKPGRGSDQSRGPLVTYVEPRSAEIEQRWHGPLASSGRALIAPRSKRVHPRRAVRRRRYGRSWTYSWTTRSGTARGPSRWWRGRADRRGRHRRTRRRDRAEYVARPVRAGVLDGCRARDRARVRS